MPEKDVSEETKLWQSRLEAAFRGPTGLIGERLCSHIDSEEIHKKQLLREMGGYVCIMDSFFDFVIQTFEEVHGRKILVDSLDVANFLATFRRFRSSYKTFWDGYYYDAASSLRAAYETIFFYGAYHNGYVRDKYALISIGRDPGMSDEEYAKKIRVTTGDVERVVRDNMIGEKSGFDSSQRILLKDLMWLLNAHVHRSQTSVATLLLEIKESNSVSLYPKCDAEAASHYSWLSVFVAWGFLRILARIAPMGNFSDDWQHRYKLLNQSYETMVHNFKKPHGRAIELLIKMKFSWK